MQIYIVISATREIELYFNLIDFRVLYVFCPLSVYHKRIKINQYYIIQQYYRFLSKSSIPIFPPQPDCFSKIRRIDRTQDEPDFLNATEVVHHCVDNRPRRYRSRRKGRDRAYESRRAKQRGQPGQGEGKCNVCLPHSLGRRRHTSSLVCRGTDYIHVYGEDERKQTPTVVNIVLLKNRTLVSVFERVRNEG